MDTPDDIEPGRPRSVSQKGPPPDEEVTRLQCRKMLWVGSPGEGPEVEWPDEPEPDGPEMRDKIKTVVAPWLPCRADPLDVRPVGGRTWNLVFEISDGHDHHFILRVSLPVYPWYKTEAEVATLRFVRDRTAIPVPAVYAFDSSADNDLGFEWILMQKLPGRPLGEAADRLSLSAVESVAQTVAEWVDQLSRLRFDSIGSLYSAPEGGRIQLGRPVVPQFMGDWRHDYDHQRGPFRDIHSYLRAFMDCYGSEVFDPRQRLRSIIDVLDDEIHRLQTKLKDDTEMHDEDEDENESEDEDTDAERLEVLESPSVTENASVEFETNRFRLATPDGTPRDDFRARTDRLARVATLVDSVPARPFGPQDTVFHHWNISESNVLIDPVSHQATGLVGWEQVYTLPPVLIRSRYPPIMARDCAFPDLHSPPAQRYDAAGGLPYQSNQWIFWERQKMREAFDKRLSELGSPWLSVGKDSKDEVMGSPDGDGLCPRCQGLHRVTARSRVLDISELAREERFCEGTLEKLEELERESGPRFGISSGSAMAFR